MKSFRSFIKEDVVPTALVKDGSIDVNKDEVRASINMALAKVTADSAITPYIALNKISKALAQFHIILPKRVYLEGAKGIEVHEIRQFGQKMGFTDQGDWITEVPGKFFLFIQYRQNDPMHSGGKYGIPTLGGSFSVTAKVVDQGELNRLLDVAEIAIQEGAEEMKRLSSAIAPKEGMHSIETCGTESTKKAARTSDRKIEEEQKKVKIKLNPEKKVGYTVHSVGPGRKLTLTKSGTVNEELSHGARELTLHAGNDRQLHHSSHQPIIKNLSRKHAKGQYDHDKATKLWKYHADRAAKSYEKQHGGKFSVADRKAAASHFADSARSEHGFGSKKIEEGDVAHFVPKPPKRKVKVAGGNKEEIDQQHKKLMTYHKARRKNMKEEQVEEAKMTRKQKDMAVRRFMSHDPKAGESILAMGKKEREEKKSFASAEKEANKWQKHRLGEEQIDELKKSTLASYIKKAHVSGLEAASQGEIAYANKDKAGLRAANKTGEKREQGIDRAASKLAKEETMEEGRMPASVIAHKQKLANMTPEEKAKKFAGKSKEQLQSMARRHGYGKDSTEYSKHVKEEQIDEKAPPGAKYERMVKHIKKGYAKGGLTAKEKGIAFATAWKAKNREKSKD